MSRAVVARLTIDGVEGVISGFRKAGEASVEYARVATKAGHKATAWIDKHDRDLDRVAGSLLAFGAAGSLALGGMVKTAIGWESAWAGVLKTVDGTPEQLGKIEKGLRDMAKVKPTAHEDLAAIAESAGQLGIETDNVLEFTATMADLAETTNMTSEEAASSLAQFMNIMGTNQTMVSRLGSTVVALGNNAATTERDIVSMGQRLAGVGRQMGLTEADVFAMAAAMASVGIEADAGGSAMSLSMKKMDAAVRDGGKSLQILAEVSGMTSQEFAAAWRDDAAMTVATFTEGLGGLIAAGGDANAILGELGMTGIRESDTLLRLAGASEAAGSSQDLLRESLTLAASAWEENTALADEAEKRYRTTEARMTMTMNSIKDEAITLGASLLPAVDAGLSLVTGLVEAFSGLPGPIKDGAAAVGLVSTSAALAAGGLVKLVVGLNDAKVAIQGLGIAMGTFTKAAGWIGVALTAAGFVMSAFMGKQAETKQHVEALTDAIKQQGDVIGESSRQVMAGALEDSGALEAAEKLGLNLASVTDAALGSKSALAEVRGEMSAVTDAMLEQINATEQEINSIEQNGVTTAEQSTRLDELRERHAQLIPQYAELRDAQYQVEDALSSNNEATQEAADKALRMEEAAANVAEATGQSADASRDDAQAKTDQAMAASLSAEEMKLLLDATQAYGNALLALSGTQIGMESSIASLAEHLKEARSQYGENAGGLDLTTEAGRENQKALDDLAASTMRYTGTLFEQGKTADEIAAATQRGRDAWIEAAKAMGMSEEQASTLADAYFAIPEQVETEVSAPGAEQARLTAENLDDQLRGLPKSVQSEIRSIFDSAGAEAAERRLQELTRARTVTIRAIVTGASSIASIGAAVGSARGNLFEGFAAGGLRENHVAQIAPAGAWRVWAEEETGGEAYIPLANDSRRGRAVDIWREVGRRFGLLNYAYGGVNAAPTTYDQRRSVTAQVSVVVPGLTAAAAVDEFRAALPGIFEQIGG